MLITDPSELTDRSTLPDDTKKIAKPLTGLEELTGADMLICADSCPTPKTLDNALSVLVLRKCIAKGVLVQRKSGMDFIGSFAKLTEIFYRMSQWAQPVLLRTGKLSYDPTEKNLDLAHATINGMLTGFYYKSIVTKLNEWRYAWNGGGQVVELASDNDIPEWISQVEYVLNRVNGHQTFKRERIESLFDTPFQVDWLTQLRCGLGDERALAVMNYCGTLTNAINYFSDAEFAKTHPIEGIGKGTWQKVNEALNAPME